MSTRSGKNYAVKVTVPSDSVLSAQVGGSAVPASIVPEAVGQGSASGAHGANGSVRWSRMPSVSNGSISSRLSHRSSQSSRVSQIEKHLELARLNQQQRQVTLEQEEERLRIEEQRARLSREEQLSRLRADAEKARLEEEKQIVELHYDDLDDNNSAISSVVLSDPGVPQDVAKWLHHVPTGETDQPEVQLQQHAQQRTKDTAVPHAAPELISNSNLKPTGFTQQDKTESSDSTQRLADAITGAMKQVLQCSRSSDETKHLAARHTGAKDLPDFHGDPEEWPMFWSRFQSTTKLCGFSDEENVVRLQRCLRGKAKESVLSMLSSASKLEDILDVLKLRFGRPDQIIKRMLEKAKSTPALEQGDFQGLLDFSITMKNVCATAESLQLPLYLNNPQLMEEFRKKLPSNLQLDWGLHMKKTGQTDLKELSQFLYNISAGAVLVCDVPVSHSKKVKCRDQCMVVTELACLLKCDKSHVMANCPKFKQMKLKDRLDFVKKEWLCFSCLNKGHNIGKCRRSLHCSKEGCKSRHHTLLHQDRRNDSTVVNQQVQVAPAPAKREEQVKIFGVMSDVLLPSVLMEIAPVVLSSSTGEVVVNAFLDSGSSCTMLEKSVAEELGLEGESSTLHLSWQGNKSDVDRSSKIVSLRIRGIDESDEHDLIDIRTKNSLDLPILPVKDIHSLKKWHHLQSVPFPQPLDQKPKIVIGKDHQHLILPRKAIEGPTFAPTAMWTNLGWVAGGRTRKKPGMNQLIMTTIVESPDEELHQLVKTQFRLDSLGIINCQKLPQSKENERAEKIMEKVTRRVSDCGWETGLLWKSDNIVLPESYSTALRRLKMLEKKMDRDNEYAKLYEDKIQEYLDKDFCRRFSHEEATACDSPVWYLPHFGVTNPNKPGKLRLVFDCAAQSNGMSINDAWLQGPDLMCSLPDVSLKFREKEVAFSGDIRDMFHMVRMREKDVPAIRFLWRGRDRYVKPEEYVMKVLLFGGVGAPYQAQYVKNKNASEFVAEFPEAVDAILNRHYMDDYLDSCSSEDEAIKKISQVREIHRRGGFEIRNWLCNSRRVLQVIDPSVVSSNSSLEVKEDKLERVLGLHWDPNEDVYKYLLKMHKVDKKILSGEATPTKRQLLQLIMSLFDPLGFIVHLTVRGRILLQDLWKSGIGWDDKLQPQHETKWKILLEQIMKIPEVTVPRCLAPGISSARDLQLHILCDASQQAFCAVAYLRATGRGGEVSCNIVMAKARVSPIKCTSIPRLEMEAALIGARMATYLRKTLSAKINSTVLWTDSRNVLCWIRAADPSRFKMYVANRIGEILDSTDVSMWRWVPTAQNVADDATRDVHPLSMDQDSRWFRGPEFLWKSEDEWPVEKEMVQAKIKMEDLEVKKVCCLLIAEEEEFGLKASDFSNWRRLTRVTAWTLRWKKNLVAKGRGETQILKPCLSVEEIRSAVNFWIRRSQQVSFEDELGLLKDGKLVEKSSRLHLLSPILVDGVICVKSRLANSPAITTAGRFPVILDPKESWTKLLIAWHHHVYGHHGIELICNELRQRYWILGLKSAVKKAAKECLQCRMSAAKQIIPEMAALPKVRVTQPSRPFTYVGVDYFGPMEVVSGRKREKRYGALFTCLSTRAVHLEVAFSLSTDDFIMALRRFIGRRGEPEEMWSDNGTNFRGADTELRKALKELDQQDVENELTGKGIKWNFIPPGSPHMGGAWERLVRSVKTAMTTILKNRSLNDQLLTTVLVEAEASVNSRPLTVVSSDLSDPFSITPNCFLMGTSSIRQPPGDFQDADFSTRKRWRHAQVLANHFWSRWIKEYLPSLALRSKWNRSTPDVVVGELVFVADMNQQRNSWTKGVIESIFPGKDGHVRVVDVRTAEGVIRRPVAKLFRIPGWQVGDSNQ